MGGAWTPSRARSSRPAWTLRVRGWIDTVASGERGLCLHDLRSSYTLVESCSFDTESTPEPRPCERLRPNRLRHPGGIAERCSAEQQGVGRARAPRPLVVPGTRATATSDRGPRTRADRGVRRRA